MSIMLINHTNVTYKINNLKLQKKKKPKKQILNYYQICKENSMHNTHIQTQIGQKIYWKTYINKKDVIQLSIYIYIFSET